MDEWKESQRVIYSEIKDIAHEVREMNETLSRVREDVAGLKVKASVWGVLGGVISSIGVLLVKFIMAVK